MKMFDNPTTITAIGGLLAALVIVIFTIWAGNVQKKQSDTDRDSLLAETRKVGKLGEKLALAQEELSNYQTGGDGYCYINMFFDNPRLADVYLANDSPYPVYDVEVTIMPWLDINNFYMDEMEKEYYTSLVIPTSSQSFKVSTMPGQREGEFGHMKLLGQVPYTKEHANVYTLNFYARNNIWYEVVEVEFDNNSKPITSHIIYKSKIFHSEVEGDGTEPEILNENISPHRHSILNNFIKEKRYFKKAN